MDEKELEKNVEFSIKQAAEYMNKGNFLVASSFIDEAKERIEKLQEVHESVENARGIVSCFFGFFATTVLFGKEFFLNPSWFVFVFGGWLVSSFAYLIFYAIPKMIGERKKVPGNKWAYALLAVAAICGYIFGRGVL